MNDTRPFRLSNKLEEITNLLDQFSGDGDGIQFWEPTRRELVPLMIHDFCATRDEIKVQLKSQTSIKLKVGDRLYLKSRSDDSAFKTTIRDSRDHIWVLGFPREILLTEKRREIRWGFVAEDRKTVLVHKVVDRSSTVAQRGYTIEVSDVSESGLCLNLSSQQAQVIHAGDDLSVEMLGSDRLPCPIMGRVVYKNEFSRPGVLGGTLPGARIGVRLGQPIPKPVLGRFRFREHAHAVSLRSIIRDQALHQAIRTRTAAVLKQLTARKRIGKMMALLESGGRNEPYLKTHIQLLAEVMCGLGVTLGWVSTATMDKLIYLAFLHDTRYFDRPHLARIRSLQVFHQVKSGLTHEEQLAFLEGPGFAAELARLDTEGFPDTAKVLLQQKEFPDGAGFPGKLRTSQLLPLSCLFIVSHELVDYVLDHREWRMVDFVKSHQRNFKGPYFHKIFDALMNHA